MDKRTDCLKDTQRITFALLVSRHILFKTTDFASMRITAVLSVQANAEKVTPLVLMGKRIIVRKIIVLGGLQNQSLS